MLAYRAHALEAFIAGLLMCLVSRVAHILTKPGMLRHEAYISTYAYLFSACVIPLFIIADLKKQQAKRDQLQDSYPLYMLFVGICMLTLASFLKNMYLDRVVM